jgi:hypothetical protein
MSTLIESTARGIKNLIPGASFDANTRAMQVARGRELIKNLALGGLAVGGTAGAAVVLGNYLKSLGEEADLYDESRLNDDTLYIPMPEKKAGETADGPRWTAPGLAVTGGVLSAGGAYALTQAIYNMIQKKRRMRLLDEAQSEALTAADEELAKGAALSMTLPELLASFPVALPLLAALASGGVTYSALNKAFPTVTKTKSKYPKRIRAVANDGAVSEIDQALQDNFEDVTKTAADRVGEEDCELAALEFMTLLTAQLAHEKKAEYCITSDILNTVARDGITPVAVAYEQGGLLGLSEAVKSAAESDEVAKVAAVVALHRHPYLAPVVASLAAAEYQELVPTVMQKVASMDETMRDKTAGIAALLQLAFMRPLLKEAAQIPPYLLEELSTILASDIPADGQEVEESARDEALTSDVSGSMAEENEGGGKDNDGLDEESQGSNDAVDDFFERPEEAPLPRA